LGGATQQGTVQTATGWTASAGTSAQTKLQSKLDAWTQADFLYGYSPSNHNNTGGVMDDLMNNGASVDADSTLPNADIQTPIMDPPVQTTSTDPATGKSISSTEQTENDYSCLVIQNGAAVKCSQAKKTTTITATSSNPNGTGTVTTTATTVVNKTADPAQDAKCKEGSVGCSDMGTPPDPSPLGAESKVLSMTNDSGWALAVAACPAPHSITVGGQSYSFGLQGMCDFATGIKPMVVAMAYLSGALLFFGLAKKD